MSDTSTRPAGGSPPGSGAPAGHDPAAGDLDTLRLQIGGMSCSFCVNTIKKAYTRIDGVDDVGISLAHEEGLIRFDPDKVSEDQLVQTLRDIGYVPRDPDKVRTYEQEEAELRYERLRLIGAGSLALLTVILMLATRLLGVPSPDVLAWTLLGFALVTMFGFGWYIKKQAFSTLRIGILNQHNLLEFGAFSGLIGGMLGLLGVSAFPPAEFFAVATFITAYHILSGYVSLRLRIRSSQSVRKLLDLAPETARILRDGAEVEIPIDQVVVGDVARIRPGDSIPVDGEVLDGVSTVDEALVTGEPVPTEKQTGDRVIGGAINQSGTLLVRADRVGAESFLAQVARSVEEARALRPGALQLVDTVLRYYVPAVLIAAGIALAVWTIGPLLFSGTPDLTRGVFAALAVLVMGYPCALGMATPLAMIRGGGMAAERGILMRSGEAFQVMAELDTVVFDKTGTITNGKPTVTSIRIADSDDALDAAGLLLLAASVEAASEHPLARAIEDAAAEHGAELEPVSQFWSEPGHGVGGTVSGRQVVVAKPDHMADRHVDLSRVAGSIADLRSSGQTVAVVAVDGEPAGVLGISDSVRPDAAEAVRRFADSGVRAVMITGDHEQTARAVADQVGIGEVIASVLPRQKAERIRELQRAGHVVAMVGDGINDAPGLTQSDIGIALGTGTDIAIESADIVILGEDLTATVAAYDIGRSSYRKTKQNLALAFAFNGIGVPLAITGLVSPAWAMVAMVTSVSAVLVNSFAGRLLRREPHAGRAAGSGRGSRAGRGSRPVQEAGPEARG